MKKFIITAEGGRALVLRDKISLQDVKEYISHISADCIAVCVYIICLPFTIVSTPFGSLLKVISMPIIAVLTYKLFFGKCKRLTLNSVHLFYSLYMLYCFGGLLLLFNDQSVTLTKDMFFAYATVLLMTIRVYNNREKQLMEGAWLMLGLICIFLGLFSTGLVVEGSTREFVVIGNNFEDPNQFCAYFLMPIIISIKRIASKSPLKPFYIGMIIMSLYAVMKGGSRGGMIAIVGAIALYAFIGIKDIQKKFVTVVAGALCAFIVVTVVFPLLPDEVRQRYSIESVAEDGGSGRFDIWAALIVYTAETPERIIHGEGIMSTETSISISGSGSTAAVAHNQFIQVFADQGIVGLLFYLAWMGACFLRNIRRRPEYACVFSGLMVLACSLTFYSFKPLTNIVVMCAMTFEDDLAREKEALEGDGTYVLQ